MAPHKVRAVVDQLAYMRARRKMGRRTVTVCEEEESEENE